MKNIKKLTALLLLLSLSPISLIIAENDETTFLDEGLDEEWEWQDTSEDGSDISDGEGDEEVDPEHLPLEGFAPSTAPSMPSASDPIKAAVRPGKNAGKKAKAGPQNKAKLKRQRRLQRRRRARRARAQARKAGFGPKKALTDKNKPAAKAK